MNDSHVSVVSLNTVLSCQAYILFYSRVQPVAAKPETTTTAATTTTATTTAATTATVPVSQNGIATALLQPALLVRTPASGIPAIPAATGSSIPLIPVSTETGLHDSTGLTAATADQEVITQSSECINALFADAAETDMEGASSDYTDDVTPSTSRLHQKTFKFYAPYR